MQIAHGESNGGDYSVLSTEYSRAGVEQFVDECGEFRFLAIDFEKQLLGHRFGLRRVNDDGHCTGTADRLPQHAEIMLFDLRRAPAVLFASDTSRHA